MNQDQSKTTLSKKKYHPSSLSKNLSKYRPYSPIDLPQRNWPNNTITKAPQWCSVDLRDGNQALVIPMDLQQKLTLFELLTTIGFKEIEVGFPSAAAGWFRQWFDARHCR